MTTWTRYTAAAGTQAVCHGMTYRVIKAGSCYALLRRIGLRPVGFVTLGTYPTLSAARAAAESGVR